MGEVADMYTQDGTVDVKGNPAEKKSTGNWRACPYILANECCERLAYYGMSTNLVNYMKTRLGQESAIAANNVTNWSGTCYITPLIGAFLADAYMGRFWTIASFMIIYILGLALLTMASSVRGLVPACDGGTCHPTEAQTGVVFLALYLIALGTGGIKPCVSSFGADQFDENDEGEKRSKSSFFNWFYFSINIGALVASSVLVYVQTHVGWGWGFGIPAVVMAVAVVSFFVGTPLYRHQRPGGSPVTRIAQVLVASARKWGVAVPADKSRLHETVDKESGIEGSRKLEHTEQFACLDRAAVETPEDRAAGAGRSPWRLCTVTQVEELKSVVRLLPIWASGIVFATVYGQMSTMFVLQGNTLDASMGPHFSIPAASLSIFDTLSVIAWVPVYDRLIVPAVRAVTGRPRGFTQLQRMGIGLVISIFSMLAAGVLDVIRLRAIARHGLYGDKDIVPISIFWQVPQYFIIGAAEVFTFVGQLEFFYDQAPDAMRSMCSALSLTTVALGNYLSTLLVTIVTHVTTKNGAVGWIPDNLNRGHLDYFFWLLAVLSLINFVVYLVIASWYTYKKTADSPDDDKADHHAAN
ncbi:protein NRT1/ PTR FAMILY 8.1-like [Oryza brachyantha]|uniref:protein NRT1/ PTR FAMILY 8.1-like n=1 Tax=Oryza brachyantha TaxID=4533 RepID=UPI001ADB066D|nr:protein NRT1/ PTR FAMILY 8.1-like [Oryza brachyantha]